MSAAPAVNLAAPGMRNKIARRQSPVRVALVAGAALLVTIVVCLLVLAGASRHPATRSVDYWHGVIWPAADPQHHAYAATQQCSVTGCVTLFVVAK